MDQVSRRTLSPHSTGFLFREAVRRSPFGQHGHLSASVVGTSTLPHARPVAVPEGLATSRTLRCCTVMHRDGTFHDSRTESVVFQAVFRWWDSGSYPQLLGSFPLPHGYLPAPSPGARRMSADPRSAFRLSPFRKPPPVPGQVGLASGRHHGRVHFELSRITCRVGFEYPVGESNPYLRIESPLS